MLSIQGKILILVLFLRLYPFCAPRELNQINILEEGEPDIIRRHGYPVETHQVTTEDGYILSIFRIPFGKNSPSDDKQRQPVFIQHGMALNSGAFINTNEKSLGFILADEGYDVWLGNFRGNRYSKNHTHLHPSNTQFWNFTFHELGVYDLPAQLGLVYKVTHKKIVYIGYSMGSTAGFVYSSIYSRDAVSKIKAFIHMAPPVYVQHSGLLFQIITALWPIIKIPLNFFTNGSFYPRPLSENLHRWICSTLPFQMKMCQFSEMLLLGMNYEQNDPETLPITLQHNSDSVSIKALSHYFQLVAGSDFQYYNYGREYNMKVYGSPTPPLYNLTNIRVPNYSFVGKNDLGASTKNVEELHKALFRHDGKFHDVHVIEDEDFNHLDFLTSKDVIPLLYVYILKILSQM